MTSKAPASQLTGLEKAKSLFLLQNPQPATERAWEQYIANRQGASRFEGFKEPKHAKKKAHDDDDDEEDEDEDNEDEEESDEDGWLGYGADESVYVLRQIRNIFADLEEEMGFEDEVLQRSFKILSCDALFEEADEPRTVTTLTRIYSPTKPTYIDVHFTYHCRSRMYEIEWYYKLGFKIYTRLATGDYSPAAVKTFERGSFEGAYSSNGWRPIAYGYFDDTGEYGSRWKRAEQSAFRLGHEEVVDVYEALCGPLEELPHDASEDAKIEHRRKLVNVVRLLLGAVGIDYEIACVEAERDDAGNSMWMLEGLSDRWLARETRKACGFQLKDDPKKEAEGREERLEEMRGRHDGYDEDDYDSDERELYGSDMDEDYF